MSKKPTVFVVDDDELARESVAALVKSMGLSCLAFASAEQFLQEVDLCSPGCVVVDVRMPGLSGLRLQERLVREGVTLPIIVVSGYANTRTVVQSLRRGAITFLDKPCNNHELHNAIEDALIHDRDLREAAARQREIADRLASLTPEERQVMELIVMGQPNKAIAMKLQLSVRTIESRRRKVFDKTRTNSVAEIVRLVSQATDRD